MRRDEQHEAVVRVLEELTEANREAPVIVEGPEDRKSLRQLGIRGEIWTLNSGTSVFNLCERVSARHGRAIILTDWDRRGGQLCKRLRDGLEANGVRYDVDVRARLSYLCRKDIKDVESLARFVERIDPHPLGRTDKPDHTAQWHRRKLRHDERKRTRGAAEPGRRDRD